MTSAPRNDQRTTGRPVYHGVILQTRTDTFDYSGVSWESSAHVRTLKVRFCLVFERELLSVPVMRQVLGDTLRGIGLNEDSVADILLAATEACTNVVLHAGQSAPAYSVAATVDSAACRVEVTDTGQGCRRTRRGRERHGTVDRGTGDHGAGDHGNLAESGRGFAIMRACVDDVILRSAPGWGTEVVLDKRIRWEVPGKLLSCG
jgi:serine/threonine-protein kinase RsbW